MFKKYIVFYTIGRYHLLILNNYSSYATAGFNKFYIKRNIIPLYLLSYLLYLLQLLNISCFLPLKCFYSQKTEEMMQNKIYLINKKTSSISILQSINMLYPYQIFKADLQQLAWFYYHLKECFQSFISS